MSLRGLEEKGHVTRGWLGVGIQDLTPDLTKSFGLTDKKGALVSQVMPGSPAAKAGIEQGDVILEFDGKAIAESKDLPQMVAATPVDKSVDVKVYRNGKTVDREVKISAMEETAEADHAHAQEDPGPIGAKPHPGISAAAAFQQGQRRRRDSRRAGKPGGRSRHSDRRYHP